MNRWAIVAFAACLLGLCGSAPHSADLAISPASLTELEDQAPVSAVRFRRSSEDDGSSVTEESNATHGITDVIRHPVTELRDGLRAACRVVINAGRRVLAPIEGLLRRLLELVRSVFGGSANRQRRSAGFMENFTPWLKRAQGVLERSQRFMREVGELVEGRSLRKRRQLLSGLENLVGHVVGSVENVAGSVLPQPVTHPVKFLSNVTSNAGSYAADGLTRFLTEVTRRTLRFLSTTGLPWTHRILNELDSTNQLPPVAHMIIQNFNVAYNLIRLLGYVN
ncbi:uncharacterized protein LOC116433412 [Nomia melanderi]|uniref:uncharacterized protein LOC116433412 n=1 Tax=Nomia melanderi TaxID=2448451 RepID=UPI0013046438|nr:uncharacterized protein LOC116433412 [Nomia melanderi]